ncbi:hypothetical protein CC85DRAFT_281453 [Cutaneotrichosporon oleaginosum]|uniref:CYTH domain-containing protein n=1 Tax=Cutaneotrichosporon oleaginosum TaxID=879819 RepID=A0A0J1BE56_9TREE|nr:uncharacterized protein CC85DRAFT_281453 [Cutaneotrichosporon oleaginosum]KLT46364.1 hypothetical protein CC85DRAFT_281453 [Cutaneotrichosporon oleaginosum]TXT15266.1 hypothetical protein COLE_01459 [Cutaneotrichosporon oleaginosum]
MPPVLFDSVSAVVDAMPSPYGLFKALAGALALSSAVSDLKTPVATHGWEIKLGLDPNGALKGGRPTHELLHAFRLEDTPDTRSYSYYDTEGHELNKAGWAIRLRHKDGKDFEATYKKRYTVGPEGLDAALKLARDEGFDKSDTNYDAEVDWTFSKKTLSFTLKKEWPAKGHHGTTLPDDDTGRHMLLKYMPNKLHNWGKQHWGDKTMATTRQHGPVTSNVWKGNWARTLVKLEVLPVINAKGDGHETIVELSFGAETEAEATSLRDKALSQMKSAGWLLDHDVLKTRIVLDRY